MSLIIEDKNALDSLANAIIGANKTITDSSATKSGLIEMINNIIPEKSKFSSGVVIPATEFTTSNAPEILFNLGNDDNGNVIIPDMILIYQSQSILENVGKVKSMLFTQIYPYLKKGTSTLTQGVTVHTFKSVSTVSTFGQVSNSQSGVVELTEKSFFLKPRPNYNWQAQMPIVWLQIKF